MKCFNSRGNALIPILGILLSVLVLSSGQRLNGLGNYFATAIDRFKNVLKKITRPEDTSLGSHPCNRICEIGNSMSCYYEMRLHYAQWAGPECNRCKTDESACAEEQCIYADGVPNPEMMAINGISPGPTIEVCEGDTVIVDVLNDLREPMTIHWHGLHMDKTPDMDGVPFVTQYPGEPGEVYRYAFPADRGGTLWYHSHVGLQRAQGIVGRFVIRQPKETNPQVHLYDYDLSDHIWMIQDIPYNNTFDGAANILLNGKGRNHLDPLPDDDPQHRYETVQVVPGYRYRFRVVLNGIFSCPVEVSIDRHHMLIISLDGNDVEPMWADSFTLTSGERVDFVLHANQLGGTYWIHIKGYDSCEGSGLYQRAVLVYTLPPIGKKILNGLSNLGFELPKKIKKISDKIKVVGNAFMEMVRRRADESSNGTSETRPHNQGYENDLPTVGLRSLKPLPWPPYTEFHTFYSKFGIRRMADGEKVFQVSDITYKAPEMSMLQARDLIDDETYFTNRSAWPEGYCSTEKCEGTHVLHIPVNQPIEMVVGNSMDFSHPYHLHGFTVRLVGQDILDNPDDIDRLPELDRLGLLQRNRVDFPSVQKDTIQVPGRGYIIVRFISYNPGFWLYHCHIEMHAIRGMMAVLKVGENSDMMEIEP